MNFSMLRLHKLRVSLFVAFFVFFALPAFAATNSCMEFPTGLPIDCVDTSGGTISDTAYGASWNGETSDGASKNAIYDKIEALSGVGEVNTASNTGSSGVGLFKQKTVADLEFYKIVSANNRLTAALSGTDYFLFTLVEANIDHDALSNFLANEHLDWTSDLGATNIHSGNIPDLSGTYQPLDSELTQIAGLTETNGNVMFVAGGVWTSDPTPAIDCTDCTNVPAGTVNTADIADVSVTQTELAELETIDATTISAAQWAGLGGATTAGIALWDDANAVAQLVTLGVNATASEINTPLDGASVTLTEFQELEAIGATTISANQWAALGGIAETLAAAELNILDGALLDVTELNYVNGVTSAIQTQLNAKAPADSPTITTKMTLDYATASELVATNASKELVSLAVATYPSLAELAYVKGVSSAVQTQITNNAALVDTDDELIAIINASPSTQIKHEAGGLEADVNGYSGLVAISGGSTSEVDAKSELEAQLADVSDLAEADGDSYTGTHNFGGADDLEVPQEKTVDTAGEVTVDTTSDQFRYYGGAQRALTYRYTDCKTLETPVDADDDIPVWAFPEARTITDVHCWTEGGTSIAVTISDGTNALEAVTCDADGADDDGSITNGTFTANENIEWDFGAPTGTVDWVKVCITTTIDAD